MQLDSIAAQTYVNWHLHVSDDGSIDQTLSILEEFAFRCVQPITVIKGPQKGPTLNFFHLINAVVDYDERDLFAYCDQDDVWLPEKIATAVRTLAQMPSNRTPNLYCGRTQTTDATLKPIGLTPIPTRPLSFGNALTQNVAGGNTMVFNTTLLQRLRHVNPEHSVWHDWSTYLVATACGGEVFYDKTPYILYRQHLSNVIGAEGGWAARLKRLVPNLKGKYRQWGDLTEQSLIDIQPFMADEAGPQFEAFLQVRHAATGMERIRAIYAARITRQSYLGQGAFLLAAWMNLV